MAKSKSNVAAQSKSKSDGKSKSKSAQSKSAKRAAATSDVASELHNGKRWEWNDTFTCAGEALSSGAQSSNDICYAIERAHDAKRNLTVSAFLAKFGHSNKALQNLGYALAAGNWKISGYAPSAKIKRADKQAQRTLAKSIAKAHGAKQIVCVRKRSRKSELGRS